MRDEKSIVEYIKRLVSNDLSGVVATSTALTVAMGAFLRLLWFVYETEYYSAIGIDNIHIVESDASFYSFVILVGVTLIILASNYFVYFCIANKVILSLVILGVVEYFALLGWVFVKSGTSIVKIIVEIFQHKLFANAASVFGELVLIVLLINLYGICFGIWKLLSNRKNKGKSGTKEDWKRSENIKHVLIMTIICVCVLMIGAAYSGREAGNEKKNYKMIFEQTESLKNTSSRAVYTNDDGNFYIKAVLFEGDDYFVTAYTYIEDSGEVDIYFEEQEIINKTGVKTLYLEDFYATVKGLLEIEQNNEVNVVTEENAQKGRRETTIMGVLAIILSLIALLVSIWGIQVQKKGIVFEKKLEIYEYISSMYTRCKRIVELCNTVNSFAGKQTVIGTLLYENGDRRSDILLKAIKLQQDYQRSNKDSSVFECDELVEIMHQYVELVKTGVDNNIVSRTELFFGGEIAVPLKKINRIYSDLCYGMQFFDDKELSIKIKGLEEAIDNAEKEDMLIRMKRQLPM